MDPLTHLILTRKFVGKRPRVILAGLVADTPFYLTYPAWLAAQGGLANAFRTNEWPQPPIWMRTLHDVFHSLPLVATAYAVTGRSEFLAWGLHILIDIPTHSRRQWAPRFLWPFSNITVDGISWAELLLKALRR